MVVRHYTYFCAMVHGVPMGVPMGGTYGVPMGYLWGTYGVPMGYLWGTYGVPMGVPMGYLWGTYGVPMGYLWGTYGVPMGYLWGIYGVFMGYLWGTYGVPMGYCHLTKIPYNRYGIYGCTIPFKCGGWLLMFFTDKHWQWHMQSAPCTEYWTFHCKMTRVYDMSVNMEVS